MTSGRNILGALAAVAPLIVASWMFAGISKQPTNDDWIGARTVKTLAEGHRLELAGYNGRLLPSAVTPYCLAGAYCSVAGFSFERLLHVSQLLTAVGVTATFSMARRFGLSIAVSWIIGATLLFNPWLWGHAFNFMTDAPAVGLAAAAAAWFAVAIRRENRLQLFGGSLLLAMAVWTRQTALGILALPAVAFLFGRERKLGLFAICATVPLLALLSLEFGWFGPGTFEKAAFAVQRPDFRTWLNELAVSTYGMLLVVGFSMIPLAGMLLCAVSWRSSTLVVAGVALLPGVSFAIRGGRAVLTSATGPFLQNAHFGPILLSDCDEPGRWGDIGGVDWPFGVWFVATLLSFVSLAIVAAASENSIRAFFQDRSDRTAAVALGLWTAGIGTGIVLLLLLGFSFDRYWLGVVGPLVGWAAVKISRAKISTLAIGWAFALLLALFSLDVIFTHDWLTFNAARWGLVERLKAEGFRPEAIDGGYEINGWHRSAEDPLTRPRIGGQNARWWNEKAERFIAVGPRRGMVEVDRIEWFSWAVWRPIPVVALCREPAPSPSPP